MRSFVNCCQCIFGGSHPTYVSLTSDLNVGHFVVDDFHKVSSPNGTLGDEPSAVSVFQTVTDISLASWAKPRPMMPLTSHLTTICSTFPILLVLSPTSLNVSGGPQRQKSFTLFT